LEEDPSRRSASEAGPEIIMVVEEEEEVSGADADADADADESGGRRVAILFWKFYFFLVQ